MREVGALAAAALLMCPALAESEDEIMSTRYGNTVIVRETFGTSRVWYDPDHTFTATNWLMSVHGRWEIKDDRMCMSYDKTPPLRSNPECGAVEPRKVGETWKQDGRSFEIKEGR